MSNEGAGRPDNAVNLSDRGDLIRADYFNLEVAADNSCAIDFIADGVKVSSVFLPAELADVLSQTIAPEHRRAAFQKVFQEFKKARH